MKYTLTLLALLSIAAHAAPDLKLTAEGYKGGPSRMPLVQVADDNGCTGSNVSPPMVWDGLPEGTRSIAVTLYDDDARQGHGMWHWLVYNIPPDIKGLPAGAGAVDSDLLPQGARQGKNDAGYEGYTGACPPVGDKPHYYTLTVWALNVDALPAEAGVTGTAFEGYLNRYAIGKKSVTTRYGR